MPLGYWPTFLRYHCELPAYYAQHAPIDVTFVMVDKHSHEGRFPSGGSVRCITEEEYLTDHSLGKPYDVVVHWRKWFAGLYCPDARNVILSQDHSYSQSWIDDVTVANGHGLLDGILVFPTWHRENTMDELRGHINPEQLYEGMTLGVDTDIYTPGDKDPYHLLWASDPGRGLEKLISPFLQLWAKDRRYHLTVTYPDYVKPEVVSKYASFLRHPAVNHKPSVRNGQELWDIFNTAAFLPYSSTFPEPSSRCHRQMQAAGGVVLYPPGMGTPSHLIDNGVTGIVSHPDNWAKQIGDMVEDGSWKTIGTNARAYAVSENWSVQAQRFYNFFSKDMTK
jgi:hypothetical protein